MGIATWHEFKPARKQSPDGEDRRDPNANPRKPSSSPSPLWGGSDAEGVRGGGDRKDAPRKPTLDEMGPGVESVPARRGPSLEGRSTMGRPGQHGGFRANKKKR